MPSFSVVIPTLREEHSIGPLLQSLLQQTLLPREIIVADGGSEDRTLEIVRGFEQGAPGGTQVLALSVPRGVSRQRNAGAARATSDLLVFMDADDRAAPDFLLRVARSYNRVRFAVACPWFCTREKEWAIRAAYFGFSALFWLGQGWLRVGSGVCIVVRRGVFEKVGGFDENLHLGEDVRLIRAASRFGLHRQLLVPLETSGRRYHRDGFWKLSLFYLKITPLILLGAWKYLQRERYEAIDGEA